MEEINSYERKQMPENQIQCYEFFAEAVCLSVNLHQFLVHNLQMHWFHKIHLMLPIYKV